MNAIMIKNNISATCAICGVATSVHATQQTWSARNKQNFKSDGKACVKLHLFPRMQGSVVMRLLALLKRPLSLLLSSDFLLPLHRVARAF